MNTRMPSPTGHFGLVHLLSRYSDTRPLCTAITVGVFLLVVAVAPPSEATSNLASNSVGAQVTDLSTVKVWVGLTNSDDVGIRFDLEARLSLNGVPVSDGLVSSASGGSSGFNNAVLTTIPLSGSGPTSFPDGGTLTLEVAVRNACQSSRKSSGRARLWYNGPAIDNGATRRPGSRLLVSLDGTHITYLLRPQGALNPVAGNTPVTVDRPVGHRCGPFVSFGSWTINIPAGPSTPSDGTLLVGDRSTLAASATTDRPPVGVSQNDIESGVIMNRLDVLLTADATVGQVNDALAAVNGTIASMRKGHPLLTIAVPRQRHMQSLLSFINTLESAGGISLAMIANTPALRALPSGVDVDDPFSIGPLSHLLPLRFPAAWNASRLALKGSRVRDGDWSFCHTRPVPVLVADKFAFRVFDNQSIERFYDEVPVQAFKLLPPFDLDETAIHGYSMTGVLAASFDAPELTGANPFVTCLAITGINVGDVSIVQTLGRIRTSMPTTGKFILNYSLGVPDECPSEACEPAHFGTTLLPGPFHRTVWAAEWQALVRGREDDFIVVAAAGNERVSPSSILYPAFGVAAFTSPMTLSTIDDPTFAQINDPRLWDPNPSVTGYDSLVLSPLLLERLMGTVQLITGEGLTPMRNTLIVGSADHFEHDRFFESSYSDSEPDILAIGSFVHHVEGTLTTGTSFAAPQVAGLASYLWLLSPALRNLPSHVTRDLIVHTSRDVPEVGAVLDAYASVLSLDAAELPTPASASVRLALLDYFDSDTFDAQTLAAFLLIYGYSTTGGPHRLEEPNSRNHGRLDLNGDGFTGGSNRAAFDLDRVGSTQYGAARHTAVQQPRPDGETLLTFNEERLTDIDVLCYYAYSLLYTGNASERSRLLSDVCAQGSVAVFPPAVRLPVGGRIQFGASVNGVTRQDIRWSVTGGAITADGIFTAGAALGDYSVTAALRDDPGASGFASVTIAAAPIFRGVARSFTPEDFIDSSSITIQLRLHNLPGEAEVRWSPVRSTTNGVERRYATLTASPPQRINESQVDWKARLDFPRAVLRDPSNEVFVEGCVYLDDQPLTTDSVSNPPPEPKPLCVRLRFDRSECVDVEGCF